MASHRNPSPLTPGSRPVRFNDAMWVMPSTEYTDNGPPLEDRFFDERAEIRRRVKQLLGSLRRPESLQAQEARNRGAREILEDWDRRFPYQTGRG